MPDHSDLIRGEPIKLRPEDYAERMAKSLEGIRDVLWMIWWQLILIGSVLVASCTKLGGH
jgi:hypothetical protein